MRVLTYTNPRTSVSLTFQFSPIIESLEGIDQSGIKLQGQQAPFQDGATRIDQLYDERTIVMLGALSETTLPAIAAKRDLIHSVLNPKDGEGLITITNDNGTKVCYGLPSVVVFPDKKATDGFQRFHIEFNCSDPYFYDQAPTSLSWVWAKANWSWPMTYPIIFGFGGGSTPLTVSGHAPTPITATFFGPATNPKLVNLTTGQTLRLIMTLATGDQVTFKTAFGKKSAIYTPVGGAPFSVMGKLDISSVFWMLPVGLNYVQFSDDASNQNASASLSFSNRYLGV